MIDETQGISNTRKAQLERAIRLFPAKLIKNFFNIETRKIGEGLSEATAAVNANTLTNFIAQNVSLTRQHAYIFELDRAYSVRTLNTEELPYAIVSDNDVDGWRTLVMIPTASYSIIFNDPLFKDELKCGQPVVLRLKGKFAIVHVTMMERHPCSFLDLDKSDFAKHSKITDELATALEIMAPVLGQYGGGACDITKGVKELMEKDIIDGTKVQHRTSNSVSVETMDEDYTIKKHRPDVYESMKKNALENTNFRSMLENDDIAKKFAANPRLGNLTFNNYPNDAKQVNNVIDLVLQYNN